MERLLLPALAVRLILDIRIGREIMIEDQVSVLCQERATVLPVPDLCIRRRIWFCKSHPFGLSLRAKF